MANFQQLKSFFPCRSKYTLDENKDNVELGFPCFRSRPDIGVGEVFHMYLCVKHGLKADKIRKFFNKKKEAIQQPDGTFLNLRDVALDYYGNLGRHGYEDISMGKEPNLNIDELKCINEEIETGKKQ